MINLPFNGHYRVNNRIFTEKIDAILAANNTLADVEWNFHDEIYSNLNWKLEPETSLDEFYKMRAQQIRDKYDYVIVMCSGGGDSTNVAYSFLNNGIHIDEVIASAPMGGLGNWNETNKNTAAENTMSETMLAQLPLVRELKLKFPALKVTINDYFETMKDFKTDDWLFRSGEWIHPSSGARYNLENQKHIRALAEAGKKIGIVYGIDKPILRLNKMNQLQVCISDRAVNVQRPAFETHYPNVENVLFYFTPDMPLMQVKQAHVLARWLYLPENALALSYMQDVNKPGGSFEEQRIRNSFFERAIIPCIYPSTYTPVFQGHKPTRMFLGEHDGWFYQLHGQTRMFEMVQSDFKNFQNTINEKYMNPTKTGFVGFVQYYNIGKAIRFATNIIRNSDW